jgi:hypothetical protein
VAGIEHDWDTVESLASSTSPLRAASEWSSHERSLVFPARWKQDLVRINGDLPMATYFGCGDFGGPGAYEFAVTVIDDASWGVYSVDLSRSSVHSPIRECQLRD